MTKIMQGDCREVLKTLPDCSVNCCVTSPPYFGLRDYGVDGQIGLEQTPDEYVAQMVAVFREVRRVLKDDGTLWLNLGDSYAQAGGRGEQGSTSQRKGRANVEEQEKRTSTKPPEGLKPKDLIGIPWRVAFALQADGWYLRQDIIWAKPNPMPESVRDRCTKSHEYVFLLSKSERYYFDADAIAEPLANVHAQRTTNHYNTKERYGADNGGNGGLDGLAAKMRSGEIATRNKRDVWTIATKPYKGAHFATFPPDLVRPCILAGCPVGGTVLDSFGGSGTTGQVANELGREAILIELNPAYIELQKKRTAQMGLGI